MEVSITMKKIKTVEAVGHTLCHDVTQVIKDFKSGALFKKGHVVKEDDIEKLLSAGKDHLYIYEISEDMLHENEAAEILYKLCANEKMKPTEIHEGKIEVIAKIDGLLKIDTSRLKAINELGDIIIATRHQHTIVKKGDKLAGTRVIPLTIKKDKLDEAKRIAGNKPLFDIMPFHSFKVGVITIGNEIYYKRIQDTFTPVIEKKLENYNLKINRHMIIRDNSLEIESAIHKFREDDIELIICTGGMSVDADDLTPSAIKSSGANILTYGVPVLSGSMMLIGYFEDETPILGLPACVMYANATSFDLIFPRILSKDKITRQELASMGHGGLCLKCPVCRFPHCEFGK